MAANQSLCIKCSKLILSHAKFCGYCGEPAGIPCPQCSILNPSDGRYCYDCGQRLHPPPWELDRDRPTYAPRAPVVTPSPPLVSAAVCQRCSTTNEPGATYCYQCRFPLDEEPEPEVTSFDSDGATTAYISSHTRANWTIALVAVVCLVSALYLWVLDRQLAAVTDSSNDQGAILDVTEDVAGVATLFLVAYVASAVAFLMWQFRVSGNLLRFGASNQRFSSGWGVVTWFIPIVNFFLPYQVLAEIWRGSTATEQESWDKSPVPAVLGVWWGLHLVGSLLSLIAMRLQDGFPPSRESIVLDMIGTTATIVGGGILIYLVKKISDRQEDRAHYTSTQVSTQISGIGYTEQYLDTGTPKFRWLWPPVGTFRKFLYLLAIVAVVAVVLNILSSADNDETGSKVYPGTPPQQRYIDEKVYMLELMNEERKDRGLTPVVLGNNVAAQLHAEELSGQCFVSHWGLDGLKPYMRYSLAGGYQSNVENALGSAYCPRWYSLYTVFRDEKQDIRDAMDGWMDSPGHRDAILDPWVRKVNIGIDRSNRNFAAVQQFEGDYVEYARLPDIEGDVLTIAGRLKNGISLVGDDSLGVMISYDSPPRELTKGQVARTECYDGGTPVVILRRPPPQGRYYSVEETYESVEFCPNPRDVAPDALVPDSFGEAEDMWQETSDASRRGIVRTVPIMHITASRWVADGSSFSVRANVVALTNRHGPGVYTIAILTEAGGEEVLVSQYSIFHEITPPGSN